MTLAPVAPAPSATRQPVVSRTNVSRATLGLYASFTLG